MSTQDPDTGEAKLPSARKRSHVALIVLAWLTGSVAVLVILLIISASILLRSERFHNYVLKTAQKDATESLGVGVHLQNFAVNLSSLNVDLYGLTVDGAAPYAAPPLLQVNHVQVGVRVVSFLRRQWYLDSFRVDRPIAHIFFDAQGHSNIPVLKSNGSSSNTSVFDLAIRRAIVDQGEFYYNDRQSALAADLHDLELHSTFNVLLQKYAGSVSYSDGHLVDGALQPIPHDFSAQFEATPSSFLLTNAKLVSGHSQALLSATLRNYADPYVDGSYDITIDGAQAAQIVHEPSVPAGQVRVAGAGHYHALPGTPLINALTIEGDLNSKQLDVRSPSLRTQILNLSGHYSLANGDLNVPTLHANAIGGYVVASGTMSALGGDSHSKVNASLKGISLNDLVRVLGKPGSTRDVSLTGALNANATASWGKNINDLTAHADATVHGQAQHASGLSRTTNTSQYAVAIESAIHATYNASSQTLVVDKSYLRTPQTNVTINGEIGGIGSTTQMQSTHLREASAQTASLHSNVDIRLQADDLREIETIADIFRTPEPGKPLTPLGLSGAASFDGKLQGTIDAPHLTGEFLASNLGIRGTAWKSLRTSVDLSPSEARLEQAQLTPADRGHIVFSASTGLSHWAFTPASPFEVNLEASQLNIADFTKLGGQDVPVSGIVTANLKLHGSESAPVGNGSVSVAGLVAYGQPVSLLKVSFTGTGEEIRGDLAAQLPSGSLQSKASVNLRQRTYSARLNASGIQLDKLQALKTRNVEATGELTLSANGQGSFDNPQGSATLQIPKLVIQNQTITGLNLSMNVANRLANATLATSAANTSIRGSAKVNLSGDYLADISLDTQAIPLQPLFAIYAPEQAADITGQTEIHATLHGPLMKKEQLEAHLTIPQLQLGYNKNVQLAATAPIRADYKDGVVNLQHSAIRGTDTDLQFQGSIPIEGNAPMSLSVLGTINLELAQLFDPDVRTSGQLKFNIDSRGATNVADLAGKVEIVDAAFASGDLPIGLQHGNGELSLTRDRLSIVKFQGTVGGGTLTAQGGVALRPSMQFDVGLAAQGLRVLYPQGMRESVDANLRLAGSTDNATLGGSINLSDLSFTNAFDLNDFIGQFSGGVSAPPTPGFSQNLHLNVAVRSTNDVNLVSRTLSIDGSANLQLRGTAATPVILGRVNLNDGDLILNGDRFVLNGGTIEFVNPSETEPVLNVSLQTTIQQYDVYLRFNGPVDQLRTNYSSDPALPSADIINLLAFGQTTEANSANVATPANQAAAGLIASQVSSQVTSRISKIAGISQLSINPVLAGGSNQGPAGANITIQQRVTGNLFVTFTSNVTTTQNQTIQGQYQLSPHVAISATRDQNGGVAFDALIKKSW